MNRVLRRDLVQPRNRLAQFRLRLPEIMTGQRRRKVLGLVLKDFLTRPIAGPPLDALTNALLCRQ